MTLGPSERGECPPCYDTILGFLREPPSIIPHGASLTISVVVILGESIRSPKAPTQAFAVNVSLVDEYGATSGGLQGSLTSNIQFHSDKHTHGLAEFSNIAICQTGPRRLRVLLGAFSCAGMSVVARADSDVFLVSKSRSELDDTSPTMTANDADVCNSTLTSIPSYSVHIK